MAKTFSSKEFRKLIQKHIGKNNFVKIYLDDDQDESVFGFIVKMSDELIMVAETHEFAYAGFKIIPEKKITGIRCSSSDKITKKIIEEENSVKPDHRMINNISLKSPEALFNSLKKLDLHCAVDSTKKSVKKFTIGEITEINEKYCVIRNYNPEGKIDKKPTKVNYKDIDSITFNDNYTLTFRKYLR